MSSDIFIIVIIVILAFIGSLMVIAICLWSLWMFYMCMMGDIIERKIHMMKCRKKWENRCTPCDDEDIV
jgi:hypothetical protein